MSTLHALLFFAGLPVLIIAVITLLVMAPSLANGPRYRPSQQWDADAEWFGAPTVGGTEAGTPALESSSSARHGDQTPGDDSGGASASW